MATLRVVVEPEEQPLASPPVLAVVITHGRHADRFEDLLGALAEQDYPQLSVLVIDAAGADDPSDRVRAVLPAARVLRVLGGEGFSAAANHVLDRDRPRARRAEFFLFCRDDVLPDARAVSALVGAATEWEADVVGPKFVARDDPRHLLHVGLGVDRVGTTMPLVERRELDQGQHDGMREVFAFPAGFTLVRADRFAAVAGFDEALASPDDDLSLCWRARAAGSRVLVATDARVRRDGRSCVGPRDQARYRVRALLSCSSRFDLLRMVPQAFALSLVQAVGGLVTGRPGRSRVALGAWVWNLLRPLSLWRARRQVNAVRQASDRDVHSLQVHGLIGPRLWLRRMGRSASSADAAGIDPSGLAAAGPPQSAEAAASAATVAPWTPATALITAVLAGVLLFGSRHLVTRFVPAVGEFVAFPGSAGDLVREWVVGYRSVGLGADASPPTLVGVVGGMGAVLGGHLALARTLLIVGLVPLGVAGAYRLMRPTGSKPAQVAAAVAYAAVPLPYDGLATGRWSVTAAYAASPWLLGRLARSSRVAPFSPDGPVAAVPRPLWQDVVATGTVTGLAGLLVPQAPALLLLVAVALVAGTLVAFEGRGIGRLVAVSVGAALVATLLHLPALVDVLRSRMAAEAWMGLERPAGGLTALDLLRFDTGPLGIAPLGFCLAGAAALPLLVGREWRLGWAVRAWMVAVACWALLWAQQQGHVDVRLPDPGVVMAPAAAALAFAVALGVAAIESDVPGRVRPERPWERVARRFGFRRMVAPLGVLALAAATAPVVAAAMDGWWDMPRGQFMSGATVDAALTAEPSRVLWVGDPAVLPGGQAWELDDGLSYTAIDAAMPGVADLWPATGLGSSGRLADALGQATSGQTSKLGRVLAPMGVQYVAVPRALAPASAVERTGGASDGPGSAAMAPAGAVAGLIEVLDGQLDLQQIAVDDALALYRNVAFAPIRATGIDPSALEETSVAAMQHVDLSAASPALVESDGDGRTSRGPVVAGDTVVQASSASDRWVLEVDGRRADRFAAYGWADAFAVPEGTEAGEAVLGYHTPPVRYLLVAVQGVLWLSALAVAVRMRFGSEAPPPPRSRPARADASSADDRSAGEPDEPAPEGEPSREGEPVPAGVGAAT
ncbi:MAG TPA: glycosyltransferase [Acidimicrobiales bacterium]|nr:glycosyltransferase [Acidimicrobiales bacterium]